MPSTPDLVRITRVVGWESASWCALIKAFMESMSSKFKGGLVKVTIETMSTCLSSTLIPSPQFIDGTRFTMSSAANTSFGFQ
jgi:hypothetical protein